LHLQVGLSLVAFAIILTFQLANYFIFLKKTIMSHGYQVRNQSGLHYLTFQIVQWADLFTRQVYTNIVIESFKYCQQNKGFEI